MKKTIRNLNRIFKRHGIQCKFMGYTLIHVNGELKNSKWWLIECEECETFPHGTNRAAFSPKDAWSVAEELLQERQNNYFFGF